MLSRETLEKYRSMSRAERFKLAREMTQAAIPYLLRGSPEQVSRRFEYLRRENDLANFNILSAIARTRPASKPSGDKSRSGTL